RRPKRGEMYRAKYVSLYEHKIQGMFRQDEHEKRRKLAPARLLEVIVGMYPHRFNLPGENEIRGLIAQLMR
ncbi:hypothetical protein PHMEG_00022507, partial [Phytophthora megakarya]